MADLRHIAQEVLRDYLEGNIEFSVVYEDDRAQDLTNEEQAVVHHLINGAEYIVRLPQFDDDKATGSTKNTVAPGTRERIAVIVDAAAFDVGAWPPTLEAEAQRMEEVGLALRKADLILRALDEPASQ